ncbi:MAG: YSC84-related protein [Chitinophagaceae bacterium]|nr:YSC84-related protein [Chitinophagaceae bacterium]
MKKIAIVLGFMAAATVALAQSEEKIESLKEDCKAAKEAFLKQDKDLGKFFNSAVAYVIFPNVGKGGLGVGGAAGNGILYEKGKPVGSAKLTQVTIGFQAGGQAYREVIFFETLEELEKFKANKVQLSAQASAVAAAAGVSANAKYNDGVAIFTMAKKGVMYEASVGGQKFKFNEF